MVSKRIADIPASGTVSLSNLVSSLRRDGADIVSFSMGEPDFETPRNVVDACIDSLNSGFTHYTPSAGIPELRKAVADKSRRDNGIPCEARNVLVTPCKHAIYMTAMAYLDPGDEVILPDPSWVSYEACIRAAGARPVFIPTSFDEGFVLDPRRIEEAITPRTRMIFLNSPSNPTGGVLPGDVLKAVAEIAAEHDLTVMSDEIYENIIYEGSHASIASLPGMFDRTVTISGLSKTYAMTGWRLGWAIAPEEGIAALDKLQSHSISCCVSFTQPAAVEALSGQQGDRDRMVRKFKDRRDLAMDLIEDAGLLMCNRPQGAFYLFPKYDLDMSSEKLSERLLREAHVAVTPGSAFGPSGEGFFRISYAVGEDQIREGFDRIHRFLRGL
ncbi:MAG: pyridoxal phosphate-dependent aminotransferase [Candidatus Methanoplasma sp.]|jgi:aspartate aminotransferase|nr:pyridoxal phosphate-dependent aminotransferase [Candidatus Methanoplasma sp.]